MPALVIAATAPELAWAPPGQALICGIGPVDGAARTATALAQRRPDAVLHVGVAGAHRDAGIALGSVVIGRRAVYDDIKARVRHARSCAADGVLLDALRAALPDACICDIATSAAVGSSRTAPVEAMEGYAVLRACELAGVPGIELRVVSNQTEETDRDLWRVAEACAVLRGAGRVALDAVQRALRAA